MPKRTNPDETKAHNEALRRIDQCRRSGERRLDLSHLRLTSLPQEIGQLTNLSELFLDDNQLTALPPEIGQLRFLTILYLRDNSLTTLPPEIGHLTMLVILHLGGNQLTTLPPQIGNLKFLFELGLQNNRLTALPPQIGELQALTSLHLQDNRLAGLPPEIGRLTKLSNLHLHDNPALAIPNSVLGSWPNDQKSSSGRNPVSPKATLDYYFALQQQGERPLNEVKLLLVGRGDVGKTSISRALRGEPFKRAQASTPGIEIHAWPLRCPDQGDEIKVQMWDFAGQEITHETHRFFLTERSLYVVVLDGRAGQQMDEAEYWLGHVERFGTRRDGEKLERSPVIVVLNKWRSNGPYDIEQRRLQREYPNIKAFVQTDCASGQGIDNLAQAIRAVLARMPAVRQPWPTTYFEVRKRLAELSEDANPAKRRHFLKWEDYRQVCAECGVTERSRQQSLAENLNALGVALYYGDDERLRDTRVLNPNWAANGLYGLVRGVNKRPWNQKPGHLWAGEIQAVLAAGMEGMDPVRGATIDDYPETRDGVDVHQFLLDLMVDRELGFQTGEAQNIPLYLLPGLLPMDEPEVGVYDVAEHMERAELRFRYKYDGLLPAGVMSRFIVRTHALSQGAHRWQRGVVLGWGNARALLLEERRRNPRVDVFIRDGTPAERQELAGVVRANMAEIHRGLPDALRGKEELDLTLPGDQYEGVKKLEQLEQAGQPVQVVTSSGPQQVPVTPQLEQVQPAAARSMDAPKLRVFVSYAHANYRLWDRFKTHLDILKNEGLVSWWFDGKIRPGSEWDDAIRRELKEADIVVLLMSNEFFASRYIKGVELREALRRHQSGAAVVLPVLLEPTPAFDAQPWLKKLQSVPVVKGQLRSISSFNPAVTGWNEVQKAIREAIAELVGRRRETRSAY